MPIKSNHDIYLFNHRNFTNYIYDNRYSIYVPDRLLLYFTLCKNKLENKQIRFDVVEVYLIAEKYKIKHIKNAIWSV